MEKKLIYTKCLGCGINTMNINLHKWPTNQKYTKNTNKNNTSQTPKIKSINIFFLLKMKNNIF